MLYRWQMRNYRRKLTASGNQTHLFGGYRHEIEQTETECK